ASDKSSPTTRNKKPSCWNCMSQDHTTKDCSQPCKLCNQNGHKHYECTLYKKNKPGSSNNAQSESMLIEEVYLCEKRKMSEADLDDYEQSKNVRLSRSGKTVNTPGLKRNISQKSDPNLRRLTSLESQTSLPSENLNNPILSLPRSTNKSQPIKAKITQIVDKLVSDSVHTLSLDEIAELSPVVRSQSTPHTSIALLGETVSTVPKGKSTPRANGWVNGEPCEVILDGGCTSFIISLSFARSLVIREMEPVNTSVMFGDDKYRFIVGREGLHILKIGTDRATHFWYIKRDDGTIPLDTYYTSVITRESDETDEEIDHGEFPNEEEDYMDQDDVEEGYLIIEASDDEDTSESKPDVHHGDRFGQPIERIVKQDSMTESEKKFLIEILHAYADCFGTSYEHLTQTNLLKFHVDTGNAKPIYKRPYSFLSFSEKQELKEELETMVKNGVLTPSMHVPGNGTHSGWSFPCRYVPKKTGDKRSIINFRKLNAVTVRDTWPLPNLVDVLESLANSKWFSVLDLLKAFQQIAVEDESIPKLTIATPWGSYSYRCIPFGVLNGPVAFSRCVFLAIQPFLGEFATNYLDDVTIFSKVMEDHLLNIEKFLTRMREVNLKINANKCKFYQQEITLLGFVVSNRISHHLHLRRHIPGFADLSSPLNELLKKKNHFIWSEECEYAFESMKRTLINATTLVIPDVNTKYKLYCDASEVGIGACLATDIKDGEKPVLCLSGKLQPAETRYPTFKIVHLPSSKNSVADALSRFPPKINKDNEDGDDCMEALYDHLIIEENQQNQFKSWLHDLILYFRFPGHNRNSQKTKRLSLKYVFENDTLYRKVGNDILTEIHDEHGHFGINASWARLYQTYWWPDCYADLRYHIRTCHPCQIFSTTEPNPASQRVSVNYIFEQFFLDFVGPLPKSKHGNVHILVAVESFTQWPIALAAPNTEAKTVANFLYKYIFCQFGPPTHILSDNGSGFDNEIINNFTSLINVHYKFTSPYRSSTNGRTEQMNGTIVKDRKKLCVSNPLNWDEHIDAVLYAYRTKANSVLKVSHYEYMCGIAPNSSKMDPLQFLGRALDMERLVELSDRNVQIDDYNVLNEEYDVKPTFGRKYFEPGASVVRVRHNKFSKLDTHFKLEVLRVISCFANGTCQLADQMGRLLKRRVNVHSLRKIHSRE
ncbi:Transposon Ty3-I Gag-Pol polyprotein, partial [Choanephora cucurbitarum]